MNAVLLSILVGLGSGTLTVIVTFMLLRHRPIVGTIVLNPDDPNAETLEVHFHELDPLFTKKKVIFLVDYRGDAVKKQSL